MVVVLVVVVVAARGTRVLQSRQQSQVRWGSVCGGGSRRKGTKLGPTHCWQKTAPISTMLRCSGLLGQVMGLVTGCEFWDIGVSWL